MAWVARNGSQSFCQLRTSWNIHVVIELFLWRLNAPLFGQILPLFCTLKAAWVRVSAAVRTALKKEIWKNALLKVPKQSRITTLKKEIWKNTLLKVPKQSRITCGSRLRGQGHVEHLVGRGEAFGPVHTRSDLQKVLFEEQVLTTLQSTYNVAKCLRRCKYSRRCK